jgi:hypothetical protein
MVGTTNMNQLINTMSFSFPIHGKKDIDTDSKTQMIIFLKHKIIYGIFSNSDLMSKEICRIL